MNRWRRTAAGDSRAGRDEGCSDVGNIDDLAAADPCPEVRTATPISAIAISTSTETARGIRKTDRFSTGEPAPANTGYVAAVDSRP